LCNYLSLSGEKFHIPSRSSGIQSIFDSKSKACRQEDIPVSRITVIAITLFTFTTLAGAQIPKGNVFFGYSYLRTDLPSGTHNNLNGWNGSLEGKFLPWIGIVADLSGHYGSAKSSDTCPVPPGCSPSVSSKMYSVVFGPRVSVSVGKITPFAHALFGAAHITGESSDTSFASAYGGGLDYHLVPLVNWRFQADLLHTSFLNDKQNNVRLSTGIVLHF
jgi:outer membrane protein with beta-barrel domain